MKKSKKILLIILCVLLAGAIGAVCIGARIVPTVDHALRISELMQPVTEAQNQAMHISVSARIGEESVSLGSDVYMVTEDNIQYIALEQNGMVLYIADNILLLENGNAFKLGEKMQEQTASYEALLPQIAALYDVPKITAEKTETETVYSVAVTGDRVDTLLAAVSLGESLRVEGIQMLDLQLTEKNEKLNTIRFSGKGELNGTAVGLDVTVSGFRILAPGDYPIPEAVSHAVATVDPNGLFSLTEDLFRLVSGLAPLADMEAIDGSLALRADCGLLQLDTEMKLSDLKTSASGQIDPEQLKNLPEMIGLLCMEGEISCTQTDVGYVYSLELDEEAMQQLSRMILPELAQYSESLSEGMVTILLEGPTITSLEVFIEGIISALIAQIPISVRATFSFD